MRLISLALMLLPLLRGATNPAEKQPAPEPSPISAQSHQLVVVRAATWGSSVGTLTRYERGGDTAWTAVGEPISVNLGRRGLAWGRGLHLTTEPGPLKRERDGRSPAGVFPLGTAFGAASGLPEGAHEYPYLHAQSTSYCVEDVHSTHYNQLIDSLQVSQDTWEQWSPLQRDDGLFDWGVLVKQNQPDTKRGAGSCVFLHIWRGPKSPTAGCTAMARESIEETLRWLKAEADPVLVQLPEPVYQEMKEPWGLP